jgi:hypothetical protein
MSNSSLLRADRATHLKIVAVSVIAAMLVIGVGISARPTGNARLPQQTEDNAFARMDDDALARMSGKPGLTSKWSNRESAPVR